MYSLQNWEKAIWTSPFSQFLNLIHINFIFENTAYTCIFIISVGLLHGDMTQMERNEVITSFKKKEIPVMVATDVAGKNIMSKYYVGIMVTFECEKGKIKFYARHSIIWPQQVDKGLLPPAPVLLQSIWTWKEILSDTSWSLLHNRFEEDKTHQTGKN